MKFRSTRSKSEVVNLSDAIIKGLASDGGLYVPVNFPKFKVDEFIPLDSNVEIAYKFLLPFFKNDLLSDKLKEICESSFTFPLPLKTLNERLSVLELFHGPTGAFKDVGARFLANTLEKLPGKRTILVATSGDTGSAVASAFYKRQRSQIGILYPSGKISEFQEMQLTCWDTNVISYRVDADFDSCQSLVKQAFSDEGLRRNMNLSSANSINIGRLLPQCVYYVKASVEHYAKYGRYANFIIPTGNMGNALACIWVRKMGFPIKKIILSCNSNLTIPEYFQTRIFHGRPSVKTLANAMDVGNPSNMERFLDLEEQNPQKDLSSISVSDTEIKTAILECYERLGYIICPHTATAYHAFRNSDIEEAIIVSTAMPVKFKEVIEPIVRKSIPIPVKFNEMMNRPRNYVEIQPLYELLKKSILEKFSV